MPDAPPVNVALHLRRRAAASPHAPALHAPARRVRPAGDTPHRTLTFAGLDADADALVAAARRAAEAASTACLVAFTTTGQTALRLSRERPLQPTLALTPQLDTARRLALAWGVESRVIAELFDPEELARVAVKNAAEMELAPPGQRVLILAGLPMGSPGAANILRLAHTPRR